MARGSRTLLWSQLLFLAIFVLTGLFALATNFASDAQDLPGWLRPIKDHPFIALIIIGVPLAGLSVVKFFVDRAEPSPATAEDVEGLHDRLDVLELGQLGDDRALLDRLPPYVRELMTSEDIHEEVWPLAASFTDLALNPHTLAKEWAISPPAALSELTGRGRLAVVELLLAYGQPAAAADQLDRALAMGVSPRAYWLYRAAHVNSGHDGFGLDRAENYLVEATAIDPEYPLAVAAIRIRDREWVKVVDALQPWAPPGQMESDARAALLAAASTQLGRFDDAILALEAVSTQTLSAGMILHLAQLLRRRAVLGGGDSRWKDAFRAVELAAKARNMRRAWRGDSAEAVAAAAEAAIIADNPSKVWALTRPAPDGEATQAEAIDSRVLPLAAMGAALTGRISQAKSLRDHAPDDYVRWRIEAEIASAEVGDGPNTAAVEAWHRILEAATSDEDKLQALRALSLEGGTDQRVLDTLRPQHPEAVAEIELTTAVMAVSGPDSDAKLRELEAKTPLASVQRAELLRKRGEQDAAGEVLEDAATKWENPRLLLMAIDCYMESGAWERAEAAAQQALAEGGIWPGRATVLRRVVDIQTARLNWSKVAAACRSLLELDENDDDARWQLALSEYRNGDPSQAWNTLKRLGIAQASTPMRAMFLLELARRFSSAEELARTALSQLQTFPDNPDVHAAAIQAITLRTDRTELPDDLGLEVSQAWASFFERYPDSEHFTAYQVDESQPLAEIEPMLRQQAANYQEVLNLVRQKVLPIGLLARVVGKPYAAIFPYRPLGYHRASSVLPQERDPEDPVSRTVSGDECIIDASALFTLALIPEVAQVLTAFPRRLGITVAGLTDVLGADDHFNLPSAGVIAYDAARGRPIVEGVSEEGRSKQRSWVASMLDIARSLRQVNHPAVVHVDSFDEGTEPVWLLGLDAAKGAGVAFWCDDLGLRRLARAYGVKTFGSMSLLNAACEAGRITEDDLALAMRTLAEEYVVDLPFDQPMLESLAAQQDWQPLSVATVLARPASWIVVAPTVELVRKSLQKGRPETYSGWVYAAFYGLKEAAPDHAQQNLTAMTTAILSEPWINPDHIKALADAAIELAPDGNALVFNGLESLWQQVTKKHLLIEALTVFLHLIKKLNDSHRHYAVQLILRPPNDSQTS